MRGIYRVLFALHVFVGIGAVGGGLVPIINPQTPLGMPVDVLKNSAFSNYLIPGIILFTIIGLGNIFSAIMFRFKSRLQGYISSIFSWALVIWIIVQCIMINAVAFLHVLFFCIGLVQAAIAMLMLFEEQLFPTYIAIKLYNKIKEL